MSFCVGFCLSTFGDVAWSQEGSSEKHTAAQVAQILARVARHEFHPIRGGFTFDRQLNKHGVADLKDTDWLVRTLAVRDLVRLGATISPALTSALGHTNSHVRHVAAMALGILRVTNAVPALEKSLREDSDEVVRSQAAVALGQIGERSSLQVLRQTQADDKSRDVQHQAELAAYAIEKGIRATPELAAAFAGLDEARFNRARVGQPAPDFNCRTPKVALGGWRTFAGRNPWR